jgi:hypothetical protein
VSRSKQLGWHWLADDRSLANSYPRHFLSAGETVHVHPPIFLCIQGLHWSERILDALRYAPGGIVCRVETWGQTYHLSDKSASEYRRILWMFDANRVLWHWLCDVAEDALRDALIDDEHVLTVIRMRREWLAGRPESAYGWSAAKLHAGYALLDQPDDKSASAVCAALDLCNEHAPQKKAYRVAMNVLRCAPCEFRCATRLAQNRGLEEVIRSEAKRLGIKEWDQ